jgi:hypothetical protein
VGELTGEILCRALVPPVEHAVRGELPGAHGGDQLGIVEILGYRTGEVAGIGRAFAAAAARSGDPARSGPLDGNDGGRLSCRQSTSYR